MTNKKVAGEFLFFSISIYVFSLSIEKYDISYLTRIRRYDKGGNEMEGKMKVMMKKGEMRE